MPSDHVLLTQNGLRYSGSMLLALGNRVPLPPATAPNTGDGSYSNPYVLKTISQRMAPDPGIGLTGAKPKRIFMNIGGRMLMKRVNRGADGWNGYITDLGPLEPAKKRLAEQYAKKDQYGSSQRQVADG